MRTVSRRAFVGTLMLGACSDPTRPPPLVPRPEPPRVEPVATALPPAVVTPPKKMRDTFAIASEHPAIVESARRVLEEGGNAIDAAVCAALAAGVAQPASTGLGADGFALVFNAKSKSVTLFDFRASAPHGLKRVDHLKKSPERKRRGVMVGVPGLVQGLSLMHAERGSKPWADLVRPAIALAEAGVALSPYMAELVSWHLRELADDPSSPYRGQTARPAEEWLDRVIPQPALALALKRIASDPRDLYEGDLAKDLVERARAFGSRMVLADLRAYKAIPREPLRVRFGEMDVHTASAPSGGGLTLAQMLKMFPAAPGFEVEDAAQIHLLAEGLRGSLPDREAFIGDPEFTKTSPSALLDDARLRERRAQIRDDRTELPKFPSIADGGTLHLSIVDALGNAVSLTSTLGSSFGARIPSRSGFFLNDALTDFAMDEYGQRAKNKGANFPRGGARPQSNMAPIIATRDDQARLVLGASGGLRAVSAPLQILLRYASKPRDLASLVALPRFHVAPAGTLLLDRRQESILSELRARGEIVEMKPDLSAVSVIAVEVRNGERHLDAAGDSRRAGAAMVGREDVPIASP
jgi:gamma-glutamyltranspeptidase / glutathione hydrolase